MMRSLLLLLALIVAPLSVHAHVRLRYTGVPIRNAASATSDGAYSTAGPCGGQNKFGRNGITQAVGGANMKLKVAYNGGHQSSANAFHAAIYCEVSGPGATFNDDLLNGDVAPAMPLVGGGTTVPATDSSTAGYDLEVTLPTHSTDKYCVLSLLDQRNWGGCVDLHVVPPDSPASKVVDDDNLPESPCTQMCAHVNAACEGSLNPYGAPPNDCMRMCAEYVSDEGASKTASNTLQCRAYYAQQAVDGTATARSTNCARAGKDSSVCVDPAGTKRPASDCTRYCEAVSSNCTSLYDGGVDECLRTCAGFKTEGYGDDLQPPAGNTTSCRLDAALDGRCSDAAPTASGRCDAINPLVHAGLNDTFSGVWKSVAGQCDTPDQRSVNTISGCCCFSGELTLIHVQGSPLVLIGAANLTTIGGERCQAGDVMIGGTTYHYDQAVQVPDGADGSVDPSSFTSKSTPMLYLRQESSTSREASGSFALGGDRFQWELVTSSSDSDSGSKLVITNDVPSTSTPRVCSIQAEKMSAIDTSAMPIPDDPLCCAANHVAMSMMLVVVTMILAQLSSRVL